MNLLALTHQALQQMSEGASLDELTLLIRRANEVIAKAAGRPLPTLSQRMAAESDSEQKRYENQVLYHAEQLGVAIGELTAWHARGNPVLPVKRSRSRGQERIPRIPDH